jgi:glycosyltransferase involved in cell wall biosynthesis
LERLRILHLFPELLGHGGAETGFGNLVEHLDLDRLDITVGGLFAGGGLVDRLPLPPEKKVVFGFKWGRYHADLRAYRSLVSFIRKGEFQIVHTHLPQGNTIGRIAAVLAGTPIVVATEHNMYVERRRRGVLADRVLSHVTTQHVAVSRAVARFASAQAGIALDRFVVIPSPVSPERIRWLSPTEKKKLKQEVGVGPRDLVVTSVGRLIRQKGHEALIQAAGELRSDHPEVRFLIVGAGPLEDALRRQVDRLGLREAVIFLGLRKDVLDLLQITDVFCFPSLWEGLGLALTEAGACRLPAVASNVGGIPEIIEHGVNGLLVEPKDVAALAQGLRALFDSAELRARLGENARAIVEERFSAAPVACRTMDLYQTLMVNCGRRGSAAAPPPAVVPGRRPGSQ